MPNQFDSSTSALELLKLKIDFWKYVADALFKFLTLAFPILYMQWSNGTKLELQGQKLDKVAVKADAAVEKAEKVAVKAEESAKVILEKTDNP